MGSHYLITVGVVFFLVFMIRTVYFNNEAGCMAIKVNDESVYNLLPSKMQPIKLILT